MHLHETLLRRLVLFVSLGIGLGATMGAVCNPQSDIGCQTNDDCLAFGEGGRCETIRFCTFPDDSCAESGRRWHDRAGSLGGECYVPVDGAGTGDTGSASDTGSDTAADTTGAAVTSESGDTSTGVATSAGDSDSDTSSSSDTGTDTSTADTTTTGDTGDTTTDTGG